jgi:hypothetical protein
MVAYHAASATEWSSVNHFANVTSRIQFLNSGNLEIARREHHPLVFLMIDLRTMGSLQHGIHEFHVDAVSHMSMASGLPLTQYDLRPSLFLSSLSHL